MPESIIVYRNPMEKAFWEGGMASPTMFFCLAMGVTFLVVYKLCEKLRRRQEDWMIWVAGTVGVAAGVAAFIMTMP